MAGFKIAGVTEEGNCEHCGAACPKRRMLVVPVDAEGNAAGPAQSWGVVCAAKVRAGKIRVGKAESDSLWKFAAAVERVRKAVSKWDGTGNLDSIVSAAMLLGLPFEIRDGVVRMWADRVRGSAPAAEIVVASN